MLTHFHAHKHVLYTFIQSTTLDTGKYDKISKQSQIRYTYVGQRCNNTSICIEAQGTKVRVNGTENAQFNYTQHNVLRLMNKNAEPNLHVCEFHSETLSSGGPSAS